METRFLSLYGTYHIAKNGVLQVTRIGAVQIAKIGAVQVTNYKRLVIDDFLTKTGANFVAGYRRRVDFVDSTAESLSFLYQITQSPKALMKSNLAENFKMIVSIGDRKPNCVRQ